MSAARQVLVLCFGVAVGLGSAPASAASEGGALGLPMATDARADLWPLAITCEIASLTARAMPARTVVVPDGHELSFQQVVRTALGERQFELVVTGRHHPDRVVELEWELRVSESRYQFGAGLEGWRGYVMHRLGLGPRPDLGPRVLQTVQADIVSTRGEDFVHSLRIGAELFEIRLTARSTRG